MGVRLTPSIIFVALRSEGLVWGLPGCGEYS
jgi:hypothetical protein